MLFSVNIIVTVITVDYSNHTIQYNTAVLDYSNHTIQYSGDVTVIIGYHCYNNRCRLQ